MSKDVVNAIAEDGTAYDLTGPENAPVVAFIHGLGLCRQVWQPQIAALSEKYRILNYDLHGHGESKPTGRTLSLTVFSEQLLNLMDYLEIPKAAIVGFSIGGMINRRFAMDHAEKVSALAILNSPHDRGAAAQEQVEARAARARDAGTMATMDAALQRWFTPEFLIDSDEVNKVRKWRQMTDAESFAQASWVLANGVRELINSDVKINTPTLVMTCENDPGSTPKMSRDIASEIAGADCRIVPELKHLGMMEKPSLFIQPVLDFLDQQLTRSD